MSHGLDNVVDRSLQLGIDPCQNLATLQGYGDIRNDAAALQNRAIGAAVLYAKNLLPDTPRVTSSPFFRMLPVISAAIITIVGLIMTAAALGYLKLNVT